MWALLENFSRAKLFIPRQKETGFTRQGRLTFQHLTLFLLNQIKGSLQQELDSFFQQMNQTQLSVRVVSKSAFTEARKKLKSSVFTALNQLI